MLLCGVIKGTPQGYSHIVQVAIHFRHEAQ